MKVQLDAIYLPVQMKSENIYPVNKTDYPLVIEVWEASVRATHHFLTEADIQFYKPLILDQYLDAVDLYCTKANGMISGFLGLSDGMVQMLFIHPDSRGLSIGKALLQFAVEKGVKKVDVNEQNQQAVGFYEHMGFVVTNRSEIDGSGKPYPILSMELTDQA
ncbi:putative acetyltransferase [Mucilaginibacter lappiensis]|uniref:Acetyltransferase n=1 Tax=Mucilaginibacter lappiensis TaxID=354630 RepID=A0ABR6PQ11_9SPHI|nr:GNAT family N-acetyltransferase [Mucilaginibacter lappiensis]MBB6111299.1 putative acetyltransferase [Mucilaginibacter lappiensis]SIR74974.1 putative acetyltransferase [Mucilaginibacter lappiensis]